MLNAFFLLLKTNNKNDTILYLCCAQVDRIKCICIFPVLVNCIHTFTCPDRFLIVRFRVCFCSSFFLVERKTTWKKVVFLICVFYCTMVFTLCLVLCARTYIFLCAQQSHLSWRGRGYLTFSLEYRFNVNALTILVCCVGVASLTNFFVLLDLKEIFSVCFFFKCKKKILLIGKRKCACGTIWKCWITSDLCNDNDACFFYTKLLKQVL